jgi:2-isopropylmalate synthase
MIQILDTTLREGEQAPGVFFPLHAKEMAASALDALGVDFIEAGHPVAGQEIAEAVERLSHMDLRAKIVAHSRCTVEDVSAAAFSGAGCVGIFLCVANSRLDKVFRMTLSQALEEIGRSVSTAREMLPDALIRFTPEDTVRSERENVIEACRTAIQAGADVISVADTTGYMIPGVRSMGQYVHDLRDALERRGLAPMLAAHCHNDRGLALANALDAYQAGVDILDASILGLGERAGIVDLATLMAVLAADFGEGEHWDLARLPDLYALAARHAGVSVPSFFPVIGKDVFRHSAGVHANAVIQNPEHYQSLDPSLVGREMEIALGGMSGASSVRWALSRMGIESPDDELVSEVVRFVKIFGRKGRDVTSEELLRVIQWCEGRPSES